MVEEEVGFILQTEEMSKEKVKQHPLFETAKEFWASPWGKDAIALSFFKQYKNAIQDTPHEGN